MEKVSALAGLGRRVTPWLEQESVLSGLGMAHLVRSCGECVAEIREQLRPVGHVHHRYFVVTVRRYDGTPIDGLIERAIPAYHPQRTRAQQLGYAKRHATARLLNAQRLREARKLP